MAETRPPLAGDLDRFREEVARPRSERPLSEQHTTYLIRRELEKGDTSFYDLREALQAIRPEITREYLRRMLDLGVAEGVVEHLPDNSWHWKGKPGEQPCESPERIVQLSAEEAARLRAWLAAPNGGIRLGPRLTVEAVEGGGLLVRSRAWSAVH